MKSMESMDHSTFAGRTVIVTGASSGIGEATAREFARLGASVVLAARNREKLQRIVSEISSSGGRCLAVETDVTSPESIREMVEETVRTFGTPDILVNNAGLGLSGRVADIRLEDLRHVYEVNVFGVVGCVQAVLPYMGSGARIVNISSVVGKRAIPVVGGYCSSKSALDALTDSLRVELSPRNIHVTSVYPGTTETSFRDNSHRAGQEKRGWRPKGVPPSKVAQVVAKAASAKKPPRDAYVTFKDRVFVGAVNLLPGVTDRVLRNWSKG